MGGGGLSVSQSYKVFRPYVVFSGIVMTDVDGYAYVSFPPLDRKPVTVATGEGDVNVSIVGWKRSGSKYVGVMLRAYHIIPSLSGSTVNVVEYIGSDLGRWVIDQYGNVIHTHDFISRPVLASPVLVMKPASLVNIHVSIYY